MQFRHATLITISGLIWLAVGTFLLSLGLNLLVGTIQSTESPHPLLDLLTFLTAEQNVILLISLALAIGYFKGKYVLSKSAQRVTTRICSFPNPTNLKNLYSMPYYLLIGGMMALGMLIKIFGAPSDIRGFVDIAIGTALINGSMLYFRLALMLPSKTSETTD